jgi:glycosyltransferase involved in cell wall biosynthesis
LWHLRRAIRDFRPSILHAHDSHALQLASWARRLAGSNAAALVATRRVDFPLRRGSVWFRADRIIAISEAVRAVLVADGVPPRSITVVHSGIDPDEVRRAAATPLDIRGRLGLPPDARLAVNVAALVAHKDQRTLIQAAHAARTLAPGLYWLIAGEGELRADLEAEIARLGLADRVRLLGYVSEADALIREADVFVMSSREEGLGSVVLHALALGTPVVATRGGGLPEIVPGDRLVPVGDSGALAGAVVRALDHPSPFPLPARFTASAMTRGVLAVYHSLA